MNINYSEGSTIRFIRSTTSNSYLAEAAIQEFELFQKNIFENYGKVTATKILKDLNSRCRHYAVGYPKGNNEFGGIWLRINKKTRLPSRLAKLREFLDIEPNIALALPNQVYMIFLEPVTDVSTIETAGNCTITESEMADYTKFLGIECPRLETKQHQMLITNKAGPNGPACISQAQDCVAVMLSTWPEGSFTNQIDKIWGEGSWLKESYEKFSEDILRTNESITFSHTCPLNAKLVAIAAPAGKSRVVYVLNWWLQMLLLPIHDSLMLHFHKMDNDCTWNQEKGVDQIVKWSSEGRKLYSFDLTAATDRWPVDHQYLTIKACFGQDKADAWYYIMKRFAPYSHEHGRYVFYNVGQPMGALSSWASLNISHHMVCRYLCNKLSIPYLYMVLGDDLVIADEGLSNEYTAYMAKLGVSINQAKSIIHEEGKPSSAEFARHLVRDGIRVGTISPNLLLETFTHGNVPMGVEVLREMKSKLGLFAKVTPSTIQLPFALDRLLTRKWKDNLVLILTNPIEGINLPIERYDSEIMFDEHISLPNPWFGRDKTAVQNSFRNKWVQRANSRLERLNALHTAIGREGNTHNPRFTGCFIQSPNHPIKRMIVNLESEITRSMWAVLNYKEPEGSDIINMSVDILIEVLTSENSVKQWRNSKDRKLKELSSFIRRVYRETPEEFKPAAFNADAWANWETS